MPRRLPPPAGGPNPENARRLTAEKVAEAVERLRTSPSSLPAPYKPTLPIIVSIRMATPQGAEKAAQRPGVQRLDEHTVACEIQRQCDVIKWITATGLD